MEFIKCDVLIIGAGPAGLTAAIYAKRAGLNVVLIEKNYPGGQIVITEDIENYPGFSEKISGYNLIERFIEHCAKFDIAPEIADVKKIELNNSGNHKVFFTDKIIETKTIIFCNGARPRNLDIPGEKQFAGKGVSYCATCDAAFFKNKKVAVIGGGDTALEEAVYLTKFVDKLFLIHRRDKFRAVKILVDRVAANNQIEIILEHIPISINGDKTIKSLTIENVNTKAQTDLQIDGVFVFAGYIPTSEDIPLEIKKNDAGYIIVDEKQMTNINGVFAAGDVCAKYLRQVITACSDGATAAFAAMRYIEKY